MFWEKQNKRWRYFAQLEQRELARRHPDDRACRLCGRWYPREEWHHFGRAASNDETIPICVTCHDYFRRVELLQPAIKGDPRHPLVALARRLHGVADMRELFAIQDRELGDWFLKLAEMHPELEMPDIHDDLD